MTEERATALAQTVMRRCDLLAQFSEESDGRLTRTFLSPPMHDVHAALTGWMTQSGLTVRIDAIGNIIGRYACESESALVLLIGSHLDTVRNAGRYDGILGVLLGLALVESLEGRRFPFAIDVIGFSEEEGVRFQTPYLGSRAVVGQFERSLLALCDHDGISLPESVRRFGLDPRDIYKAAYPIDSVIGYIEAHIEQGPVLEERGLPVGVVSAIAGQSRLRLRLTGQSAHAGTTPMNLRRDALAGAAEVITTVEKIASETSGLVATVGTISVEPNIANVIAGAAEFNLDVRHADDAAREKAVSDLLATVEQLARRRGLTATVLMHQSFPAVAMDDRLRRALAQSVSKSSIAPALELVSGAGHDAAIIARAVPSGMLFLRCPNGGLSHHPDESVAVEDIAAALQVLSCFVVNLSNSKTSEELTF